MTQLTPGCTIVFGNQYEHVRTGANDIIFETGYAHNICLASMIRFQVKYLFPGIPAICTSADGMRHGKKGIGFLVICESAGAVQLGVHLTPGSAVGAMPYRCGIFQKLDGRKDLNFFSWLCVYVSLRLCSYDNLLPHPWQYKAIFTEGCLIDRSVADFLLNERPRQAIIGRRQNDSPGLQSQTVHCRP